MKLSLTSFNGFALGATDGEIGKIKEIYFDDESWTVRYLIVQTGSWLLERKVLISPEALTNLDWRSEVFGTNLTLKQIEESPDIDTDQPVYRQQEAQLYEYFPWRAYWFTSMAGAGAFIPSVQAVQAENRAYDAQRGQDNHLRSSDKVTGYQIHATDGELGELVDFVINLNDWRIEFLIVETGGWLSKRKIILSPGQITDINWGTSRVIVNVTVDEVKNSPEFDPEQPINEVYEKAVRDYYGQLVR